MNRFKPLKNILLSNDVFIYIIYIIIFTIIIAYDVRYAIIRIIIIINIINWQ